MKKWGGVSKPKTTLDSTVSMGLGMFSCTNTYMGNSHWKAANVYVREVWGCLSSNHMGTKDS